MAASGVAFQNLEILDVEKMYRADSFGKVAPRPIFQHTKKSLEKSQLKKKLGTKIKMATKPPIFLETMDFEKHCEVLFYKKVAPMPILQYPKESPKVPNEKK